MPETKWAVKGVDDAIAGGHVAYRTAKVELDDFSSGKLEGYSYPGAKEKEVEGATELIKTNFPCLKEGLTLGNGETYSAYVSPRPGFGTNYCGIVFNAKDFEHYCGLVVNAKIGRVKGFVYDGGSMRNMLDYPLSDKYTGANWYQLVFARKSSPNESKAYIRTHDGEEIHKADIEPERFGGDGNRIGFVGSPNACVDELELSSE